MTLSNSDHQPDVLPVFFLCIHQHGTSWVSSNEIDLSPSLWCRTVGLIELHFLVPWECTTNQLESQFFKGMVEGDVPVGFSGDKYHCNFFLEGNLCFRRLYYEDNINGDGKKLGEQSRGVCEWPSLNVFKEDQQCTTLNCTVACHQYPQCNLANIMKLSDHHYLEFFFCLH